MEPFKDLIWKTQTWSGPFM